MVIESKHTLQTRARLTETTVIRRFSHRVRVRWPTTLITSNHETLEGMTRNLNSAGVFLYYSHTDPRALPLRADERVIVIFKIPGRDHIEAIAQVVWSDFLAIEETSTILGVGLEFVELGQDDQDYFLRVITDKTFQLTLAQSEE